MRPRTCPACGDRPVATARHAYCYNCQPGGPQTPPPCRRCGSLTGYYSAGLCRRCHRFAPQTTDSCIDCYAWGVTRYQGWLCEGCDGWRRRFTPGAPCPSCRRIVAVNADGWCRLCWRQAAARRTRQRDTTVLAANRHGQQLFFADMFRQKRPAAVARPGPAVPRPVGHYQLTLFAARRDLTHVEAERLPQPADPELAEGFDRLVLQHARGHGWSKSRRNDARRGIRILLALQDAPGAPIPASDVAVVKHFGVAYQPVLDVLAAAGLLIEDRQPALLGWFTKQVAELPDPMTSEVRTWFDVLREGSTVAPRSRPHAPATVRLRIHYAKPALHSWAADGHRSLREISRADVLAALPPEGTDRALVGTALRSLFTVLKGRRLLFTNPATRLRTGRPQTRQPLPLPMSPVRQAIDSDRPDRAALTALIAFHALRTGQLRRLHLTDLRDGRLRLAERTIPLAGTVRHRIAAWLDQRTRRWPGTVNPHLFINASTAGRLTPVSHAWINHTLAVSAQGIREDRILHEATATGGDIRRLCDLFGLSVQAAARYAGTSNPTLQRGN